MSNLCYFRIEGYEGYTGHNKYNFIKEDFNFSNEFNITFKQGYLKIDEINSDRFFYINKEKKNIYNVTGIIGKNGSGKTALLNFITRILCNNDYSHYSYIIVLKIKDIITIIYNNVNINNISEFENNSKFNVIRNDAKNKKLINDLSIVFYSSGINLGNNLFPTTYSNSNMFNISLHDDISKSFQKNTITFGSYAYKQYYYDSRFEEDYLKEVRNYITKSNMKFLVEQNDFNVKELVLFLKFFKDSIDLFRVDYEDKWRYIKKYSSEIIKEKSFLDNRFDSKPTSIEIHIYKTIEEKINNAKTNKEKIYYMCFFSIVDMFFQELYNRSNSDIMINIVNLKINNIKMLKDYKKTFNNIMNSLKEINLEEIKKSFFEKTNNQIDENSVKIIYGSFHRGIIDLIDKYNNLILLIDKLNECNNIEFQLLNRRSQNVSYKGDLFEKIPLLRVNCESFNEIRNHLNNIEDIFILDFKNLSSGEQAFLNIYSKLYSIKDDIKTDSVIVILDEPELYFHPEWQRCIIYKLIEFFNKYYNKEVQIIISSNSPYILSDLPRDNVIMLDNTNISIQTFGNTIHSLLKNTYFMNSTIGEFSKHKIDEIIYYINSNDNDKDNNKSIECKKNIEIIGDEILKNKLIEMLEEKNDKN